MPGVDLRDRAIAITGASSGIGRATAISCAQAGMDIALGARRLDRLEAVAGEVRAVGRRAEVFEVDVGESGKCHEFIDHAASAFGRLDAVFANAGYGFEAPTLDRPIEDHRRMFEVNFWGSLETVRAAIPHLRRSDVGHALLCSSCLSKIGLPCYAAYCATKAAQDFYGRALRVELAPAGVAVSTVHPIGTTTEFFDTMRGQSGGSISLDPKSGFPMQPPERVARAIVRRLRKGRGAEVWTSLTTRLLLAIALAAPGLTDRALARKARERDMTGEP
ncbi:MAG: SDR family NAD(P)-dependent oxidoreductase [Planctomycetota bacterium]